MHPLTNIFYTKKVNAQLCLNSRFGNDVFRVVIKGVNGRKTNFFIPFIFDVIIFFVNLQLLFFTEMKV